MIDTCCDANFTKANVVGMSRTGDLHYQLIKYSNLNDTKALLRILSNSSIPIKQRKNTIQRGSGFASLLLLLLCHIVAGRSRLIKGK